MPPFLPSLRTFGIALAFVVSVALLWDVLPEPWLWFYVAIGCFATGWWTADMDYRDWKRSRR